MFEYFRQVSTSSPKPSTSNLSPFPGPPIPTSNELVLSHASVSTASANKSSWNETEALDQCQLLEGWLINITLIFSTVFTYLASKTSLSNVFSHRFLKRRDFRVLFIIRHFRK